ncbi:MAG: protein kinase [bacterium]|nr:protein kinase [bacterium]
MHEIEGLEGADVCPRCGYDLKNSKTAPHQLQPFSILNGKYLIGKVIGEGGFGITYLGKDLTLDIIVAIKEFYPNGFVTREAAVSAAMTIFAGSGEKDIEKWRDNFIKEARSLAKFNSLEGIVKVREFFYENNTAYIVMEYIDGITLKSYLKQNGGRLPVELVLQMMQPVIYSLQKVHEQGIIHRDISPDNIMINNQGRMKVLDFGAAREVSGAAEKSLSVMLKPGYAPEEQYRTRGRQGPWSDVYALCATIYKCITGTTPVESMERLRSDSLKMPGEMGISVPETVEAVLRKGMAVYAEERIQTMGELYAALYQSGAVSSGAPQTPSQQMTGQQAVPRQTMTQQGPGQPSPQQMMTPQRTGQPSPQQMMTQQRAGQPSPQQMMTPQGAGQTVPQQMMTPQGAGQAAPQQMMTPQGAGQTVPQPLGGQPAAKQASGSKNKYIIAAACGGAVLALIMIILVLVLPSDTDSKRGADSAASADHTPLDETPEETDIAEVSPTPEADVQDETAEEDTAQDAAAIELEAEIRVKLDILNENAETSKGNYLEMVDRLDEYYDFAVEYNVPDRIESQVQSYYKDYQDLLFAQHESYINSQVELGVYVSLYNQMSSDYDSARGLVERFGGIGIVIDDTDIENGYSQLRPTYKNRVAAIYDAQAESDMNNNGVISRSTLWSLMEHVPETDLYGEELQDPIRRRYAYALALHIDSELSGLDNAQAITKIYNALEETDFCPLLLYYLAYAYGDIRAAEWLDYFINSEDFYEPHWEWSNDVNVLKNQLIQFYCMEDEGYSRDRETWVNYMTAQFYGQ